jgi:hypothetical protein
VDEEEKKSLLMLFMSNHGQYVLEQAEELLFCHGTLDPAPSTMLQEVK